MIYELRLYYVAPGRMADVHARFRHFLPKLFARHGVNCIGRWATAAGPATPRFVYLMAYRDYAEREAIWAAFYADPEWWEIRAATNAGSEMVERHDLFFLKPSPVWQSPAVWEPEQTPGGLHELSLHPIAPGQGAAANAFLTQTWLPLLQEAGARTLGIFDFASGTDLPRMALFHAWPGAAERHAGWQAMEASPRLAAAFAEQRSSRGTSVFLRSETALLEPST